ncbi:MAG: type III pantothenate kinase [Balneola sp.]|nr:type III pantothenate kinase [Balneola sp.]MBO6650813.1 type III pantothenate kinase [Balneola sp.]MBO6710078.1 type III pantothenate kinase [Balneola sp.]MBO6798762.1 type III pantothenate kinase [Balneola sp.]MBO6869876.1 type III pantothenate kinase [Balneola sp.]
MSKNDSENSKKRLFLDIGNSSIKVAFRNNNVWEKSTDNFKSVTYLISWLNRYKDSIQDLVVASVRKDHFELLRNQVTEFEIKSIEITDVPEHNLNYHTPKTLGIDRFLGCLGALTQEKESVVVVDAGSACTIDIMNESGIYQGGVIMPGLQSILNIFKTSAPELPAIETEIPTKFPGKSTAESLQWGQVAFFVDGINASLKRYQESFGHFNLYLTGGDARTVSGLISMNSKRDEFLIFKGMEAFIRD